MGSLARACACAAKVCHASRRVARVALAAQVRRADRDGRRRPALVAYCCPHCGGWHVGRAIRPAGGQS